MLLETRDAQLSNRVALDRFRKREGRPLFLSDWLRALFIHYEVDPDLLQREVPFELDLRDGRAYVSLVAFTMKRLRFSRGGPLTAVLTAPVASHDLFNVRTYVRHRGESGIYFIAEWIPNRLNTLIGPRTYGLPYRYGRLDYRHHPEGGELSGRVSTRAGGGLSYLGHVSDRPRYTSCEPGSLAEFLLDRYTAYTRQGSRRRLFRIWHEPWPQTPVEVALIDTGALGSTGRWPCAAELVAANYSPGLADVWIGRPRNTAQASV